MWTRLIANPSGRYIFTRVLFCLSRRFDANSMHMCRSALSTCVVKDLPDIDYYMPLDSDRLCHEVRTRIDQRNRAGDVDSNADPDDDDDEWDRFARYELTYDDDEAAATAANAEP